MGATDIAAGRELSQREKRGQRGKKGAEWENYMWGRPELTLLYLIDSTLSSKFAGLCQQSPPEKNISS